VVLANGDHAERAWRLPKSNESSFVQRNNGVTLADVCSGKNAGERIQTIEQNNQI
jgi:hypothetical protein